MLPRSLQRAALFASICLASACKTSPLSSGGETLAYLAHTDGFWQVWSLDLSRLTTRQITQSPYDKTVISWYPDGQHLLVNGLDGRNWLYCPAPTGFGDSIVGRSWSLYPPETVLSEADANTYLSNQFRSDPDIWVIELEDKDGRHFLEDALIEF